MTEEKEQEWAKYIYGLLGCDYYVNLSSGAIAYLEKCEKWNNTAEHDFLQDLADLDVSVCNEYYSRQPEEVCIEYWKELESRPKQFLEYDPILNTMTEVCFRVMYPNDPYNPNKYHPVKFYAEYGFKPILDTFELIEGKDIGGWCFVWENEKETHTLLNAYNKLLAKSELLELPNRLESKKLLQEQANLKQQTLW